MEVKRLGERRDWMETSLGKSGLEWPVFHGDGISLVFLGASLPPVCTSKV